MHIRKELKCGVKRMRWDKVILQRIEGKKNDLAFRSLSHLLERCDAILGHRVLSPVADDTIGLHSGNIEEQVCTRVCVDPVSQAFEILQCFGVGDSVESLGHSIGLELNEGLAATKCLLGSLQSRELSSFDVKLDEIDILKIVRV
jgi:hypothetical protein